MTSIDDMDTDQLLNLSLSGQRQAEDTLFSRHRDRLRRMVGVRLDPAMHARIDPSDIVQETLAEAHRRLPEYRQARPLPFYPWLRQLAWQQLVVTLLQTLVLQIRFDGLESLCWLLLGRVIRLQRDGCPHFSREGSATARLECEPSPRRL